MSTNYRVTDPEEFHDQPVANIWLADDGAGNVDVMINDLVVAFFNAKGELWRVNFSPADIGPLQRAGIRFERADPNEEFFVIKTM